MFTLSAPLPTNINNNILTGKGAMPLKGENSNSDSNFSLARHTYVEANGNYVSNTQHVYRGVANAYDRAPRALIQNGQQPNQKKYLGNRDSSAVTARRRVNAVGNNTLNAGNGPISFNSNSEHNYNTRNDALTRVRGGGAIVPSKVSHKYILQYDYYLATRYLINYPWQISPTKFDSEICEIECSRYGRYVTILTKRKIWRSDDYGVTWNIACDPNNIVVRTIATVLSVSINAKGASYNTIVDILTNNIINGKFYVHFKTENNTVANNNAGLVNGIGMITSYITFDNDTVNNILFVFNGVNPGNTIQNNKTVLGVNNDTDFWGVLKNTIYNELVNLNALPLLSSDITISSNIGADIIDSQGNLLYNLNTYNGQYVSILGISPNGKYQVTAFATNNVNILYSVDYGKTWHAHTTSNRNPASGIGVTNNGTVIFSNNIYTNPPENQPHHDSFDSTLSYNTVINLNRLTNTGERANAFTNTQTILNVASSDDSSIVSMSNFYDGVIYVSRDGGLNFNTITKYLDVNNNVASFSRADFRDLSDNPIPQEYVGFQGSVNITSNGYLQFITDKYNRFFRSQDGGFTWKQDIPRLDTGEELHGNFQKRSISPDGKLHIISAGTYVDTTVIYFSSDFGYTWTQLNAIYRPSTSTGYTPILTANTFINYDCQPKKQPNPIFNLYYFNNKYPSTTPEDL
jgi:hypothetical protein